VLAGFHAGHRRAYRRSLREGVEVRRGSGPSDCRAYVELYENALDRWGDAASSRYRAQTFECMTQLADEHPDAVALWLAEVDGHAVAGAWAFCWNGCVSLWHGVAQRVDQTMISPPTALYGEIIRDAISHGRRRVDFNPSGGHAGPEAFKRRLGTVEMPVMRLRRATQRSVLRRAARAARRAVAP
jgi:hypothetical protein